MKRRLLGLVAAALALGAALAVGVPSGAADFSADLVVVAGGRTMLAGKIYVQGADKVRQETLHENAAAPLVTIIRRDKKVMWTLLPTRQYLELPGTVPPGQSRFPVPAQAIGALERVAAGVELVNGHTCDVFQYVHRERRIVVLTEWKARDLDCVIKTELVDPETPGGAQKLVTEYQNIKVEAQPDSLFEVPAGYRKMSLPLGLAPSGGAGQGK